MDDDNEHDNKISFDPYVESKRINDILKNLFEKEPVDVTNYCDWLILIGNISHTLKSIKRDVDNVLNENNIKLGNVN